MKPEPRSASPKPGHTYLVRYKGREELVKVLRIATVRSGAVLAFCDNGKGIPVTTYATWTLVDEEVRHDGPTTDSR
jgi:hypothetical protein